MKLFPEDNPTFCVFKYLREYYLTESRHIKDIFDSVIFDCVKMIRTAAEHSSEYNPEYNDAIDFETSYNVFYTGWCFNSDVSEVIKTTDETNGHPIYLVYHLNSGMKNHPVSIDEREDYDSEDDKIYINANIDVIKNENVSDSALENGIVHELVHLLQMWYDGKGKMSTQNTAYREFHNFDYLKSKGLEEDFVSERILGTIFHTLYLISATEIEARQEEIDNYIRQYALENVITSNSINSKNYVMDFLVKACPHITTSFPFATKLMSRILELKDEREELSIKVLCLFTSILVDMKFIDDTRDKDFENYKQCVLIQDNKFVISHNIANKMNQAAEFLAGKLDNYIKVMYKEIESACKKYKVGDIVMYERKRPSYKCSYLNETIDFYKESEKIHNMTTEIIESVRNGEFLDYRKMVREQQNKTNHCDYLIEMIQDLNKELFTETTLKIGSLTFGPY